ncbi:hypothetical protein WISP_100565 [Willisornis vidua]|uniref:THD domain-containing protein n=1 Tax=Willisornis vidua TaxID=1566151 RepID=A0ABQ9CYQ3_9PASS|nr:hypothetical protein WISP_100565 [Willisornis vidua]
MEKLQQKTLTKDCFFPQSPGSCWAHGSLDGLSKPNFPDIMSWKWELKHCSGFVEEDNEQFLIINQSGIYFIYAQVYRRKQMRDVFTLKLYKHPNITLNEALGPKEGDESGTINFARLFFLSKGDRLYCSSNFEPDEVVTGTLSYWGLYKM